MNYTTEIKKDLEGNYQVSFTIGNQTFYLESFKEYTHEESEEKAQWLEKLLWAALDNLKINN